MIRLVCDCSYMRASYGGGFYVRYRNIVLRQPEHLNATFAADMSSRDAIDSTSQRSASYFKITSITMMQYSNCTKGDARLLWQETVDTN